MEIETQYPATDPKEFDLYCKLEKIGEQCWENRERQRELSARIRAGNATKEDTRNLELLRESMAAKQQEGDRLFIRWMECQSDIEDQSALYLISLSTPQIPIPANWADRVCHRHNFREFHRKVNYAQWEMTQELYKQIDALSNGDEGEK